MVGEAVSGLGVGEGGVGISEVSQTGYSVLRARYAPNTSSTALGLALARTATSASRLQKRDIFVSLARCIRDDSGYPWIARVIHGTIRRRSSGGMILAPFAPAPWLYTSQLLT